jgi:hypothetical protein
LSPRDHYSTVNNGQGVGFPHRDLLNVFELDNFPRQIVIFAPQRLNDFGLFLFWMDFYLFLPMLGIMYGIIMHELRSK